MFDICHRFVPVLSRESLTALSHISREYCIQRKTEHILLIDAFIEDINGNPKNL